MNSCCRRIAITTVGLLLQACGSTPQPQPPAAATEFVEAVPIVVLPAEPTAYEIGQRERAIELERRGRLAESALAWEVLTTIRPRHDDYRERWLEVKRKAASAAADRVQRGDQAAARGQIDTAVSNYLAALAFQPDQARAAEALRGIERERIRRSHLGKLSRLTLTRKSMADAEMSTAAPATKPGLGMPTDSVISVAARGSDTAPARSESRMAPTNRVEIEHASLLASQGEYTEAVTILEAWLDGNHRDDAVRNLLADVLFQQAESIAPSDPDAAIDLLERSMQLNRKHPRAGQRLKSLRSAAAQPARK